MFFQITPVTKYVQLVTFYNSILLLLFLSEKSPAFEHTTLRKTGIPVKSQHLQQELPCRSLFI